MVYSLTRFTDELLELPYRISPWRHRRRLRVVPLEMIAAAPVAHIDPCYLSFSIDISVLAGGQWWEGTNKIKQGLGGLRVEPLKLRGEKLDGLTRALGPAYLRVGGSEADKIHYFSAPEGEQATGGSLVLTQAMWDDLQAFVKRNELKLSFTFKYGLFKRSRHGAWGADEVRDLLAYSQSQGHRLDICELGNELNAYWAFHGLASQPKASDLALDYATFSQEVKEFFPEAKIIGPGSAFWPRLGETIKPFSNISQKFLAETRQNGALIDVVDWHYYPFQSRRSPVRTRKATKSSMLRPGALNEYRTYCQQVSRLRDTYFPDAELWTGETGSAQCGGEPKLSDRFASCFWWADQLGLGARHGQQVMIRQSLVGGEYGLLERLTLKPRPDYWVSWLWKQLMGREVFEVESGHNRLRAYCHSAKRAEAGSEVCAGGKERRVLLLINLSGRACSIAPDTLHGWFVHDRYVVSGKKLTSKKLRINGKKARLQGGQVPLLEYFALPKILPFELAGFELPAHALAFFELQKV